MTVQNPLSCFFSQDKSSSPQIVNYDKNFQVEKKRKSKTEYNKAYDVKRKRGFIDSWLIDSRRLNIYSLKQNTSSKYIITSTLHRF